MHTVWKGAISFGLVNIPIKMYASIDEKNIKFKYLHGVCRTPVKMVRMCPHCNVEVSWEDVVRGYEHEDGSFVIIEKEELNSLTKDQSRVIEILDFVELHEIDPIYFNKTYFLGAQDGNNKAYALLRIALQQSDKIGIAAVTIRSKRTLAVIRVYNNCLVMETIYYPDEIRSSELVPNIPEEATLPEKEVTLAHQLINQLSTHFDLSKYTDEYRTNLKKLLENKVATEETITPFSQKSEKVLDLMAALQASLAETNRSRKSDNKKKA